MPGATLREIVPSFLAFTYFSFAIRGGRLLSNAIYPVRLGSFHQGAFLGD
jgi:hypothetical protein